MSIDSNLATHLALRTELYDGKMYIKYFITYDNNIDTERESEICFWYSECANDLCTLLRRPANNINYFHTVFVSSRQHICLIFE